MLQTELVGTRRRSLIVFKFAAGVAACISVFMSSSPAWSPALPKRDSGEYKGHATSTHTPDR